MINKETYKDIGKAKENCLTDSAEFCYLADSFFLLFTGTGEGGFNFQ
jgi:hypothetical protein